MMSPDKLLPMRQARRGFTLLEVMLVLAIVAMIGAIAVPRMEAIYERYKLRGMANELRLIWDTARLDAMRTGQSQVFQCLPESGSYSVAPLVLQSDTANAGTGATVMLSGGAVAETQSNGFLTAVDAPSPSAKKLEEGITFVSCLVVGSQRAYAVAQDAQASGNNDVNSQTAGQAVIFYPDGSTSTAEVRIQNEHGDMRAVQLRGLTGHSRVVEVANAVSDSDEREAGRNGTR
ncbi:MAG: prepilin-type N-terminal cleavage/methylation domain-containing protein [Planctomycetales bacterium]|nr:prepilin-type N-terminal cleavage/methylation domain-containing protein [Planctomycetales bacterium]